MSSRNDIESIWNDGPLQHDEHYEELRRVPNKEVVLKRLYNLQNIINDLLYESKLYSIERDKDDYLKIYGISQNPDTKYYILVFNDAIWKDGPLKYDENYKEFKRAPNKRIALKHFYYLQNIVNDFLFEIKPYPIDISIHNKLLNIYGISQNPDTNDYIAVLDNEISKSDFTAVYSAIWKDGPLQYVYKYDNEELKRIPNKEVVLKCLYNSQVLNNEFFNEIKSYPINKSIHNKLLNIYGISQNPDTKDYIIVLQDGFCENCGEIYTNVEKKCKEIGEIGSTTIYSAIWKNGPLQNDKYYGILKRIPDKKVTLKSLHNSQNITNKLLNEIVKEFSIKKRRSHSMFGISQNQDTKDYIIVLDNNYCENFEWIPYNQFNDIKELSKNGSSVVCSAIWKRGPLTYYRNKLVRELLTERIFLKYFYGLQNIANEFNEFNEFLNENIYNVYGISQNPDTKDYIIVLKNCCKNCEISNKDDLFIICSAIWEEGLLVYGNGTNFRLPNEKVILKYLCNSQDIINELLNEIKKYTISNSDEILNIYGISQNPKTKDYIVVLKDGFCEGGFAIVYSAIWKDGPLQYVENQRELKRNPNKKVALKCLNNSQNINNEFLNEVKGCWDSNPNNRPSANEIAELIGSFTFVDDEEIKKQIEEADEYRKANFSNSQLTNHHPKAYYTSRLLNPFTKELPKYDNIDNNSVEIVDFGKISDEIENQQLEEK
ncbi:kinase-like domain-containing protein [Rhizophagus irregularis DAOM 181602=DAOM 197198]|nr:kinase-like domain-containing protein [Rhizophagus irregularis DAOM 181602=DAOM 197198]